MQTGCYFHRAIALELHHNNVLVLYESYINYFTSHFLFSSSSSSPKTRLVYYYEENSSATIYLRAVKHDPKPIEFRSHGVRGWIFIRFSCGTSFSVCIDHVYFKLNHYFIFYLFDFFVSRVVLFVRFEAGKRSCNYFRAIKMREWKRDSQRMRECERERAVK